MKSFLQHSIKQRKLKGLKSFAVLIDPDKVNPKKLDDLVKLATDAQVDYFFVGGSLVISNHLDECIQQLKKNCSIPVILFPGSHTQVSSYADALFYLSLLSGRNPDLLIGQHVVSAPMVKKSGLEIIPTGYLVVDGGAPTTVSYMSNAAPIPADKADIAMCTAMAGEMLGKQIIYMDAGSGAKQPITTEMIKKVAQHIELPLIVGGGIKDAEKAYQNCKAGADIIVIGNAIEKNPALITDVAHAIHSVTTQLKDINK